MIGQMIMTGFRGTGDDMQTGDMPVLLEDIQAGRTGGVILFERDWETGATGRNITSVPQVARLSALLQRHAPIPLFIAVDQEGGKVRRLKPEHGFPPMPSAGQLGALPPGMTRVAGLSAGRALAEAGINLNFAPVADVGINPSGPAIAKLDRAFSADPETSAAHAAAFASGLGRAGVIAAYKHFPGHGSAEQDTHQGITDITATWQRAELRPYLRESLPTGVKLMVMTGHLMHRDLDPWLPASLSRRITTDLLRNELGWEGVVITDDLNMEAIAAHYSLKETIRLAVEAGADILLFGNNLRHDPLTARTAHALLMELVEAGDIDESRIEESWRRIRTLKQDLPAAR
jgi:beta-N-acetylhexosaminidase